LVRIKLTLPYNSTYIKKIKTIPGYRWHPDKKYWSFPYSKDILKRILSIFKAENIQLDSTLQVSFNQKSYKQTPNQIQIAEAVKKELKLRGYSQNTRKYIYIMLNDTLVILQKIRKSLMEAISEIICFI